MIKNGLIRKGESPFSTMLEDYGYSGFLDVLREKGENNDLALSYNDLLKAAGFKINLKNWSFLDIDNKGNQFNREEQIEIAAKYFIEFIIPEMIKKGIINDGEPPSRANIISTPFRKFLNAIVERNLTYNEILIKAGLELNYDPKKWMFLFQDSRGNNYTYEESMKIAVHYFKNVIIAKLISKKKIPPKQTPTKRLLINYGYAGFLDSLYDSKWNISYNELVQDAGLVPNDLDEFQKIGTNFHRIAERILMEHANRNNLKCFNEIYPSPYNEFHKNRKCDNVIIINESITSLSNQIKHLMKIRKDIELILIDYFLGPSESNIKDHCLRGYQGHYRLLILVPVNALEPISTPFDVQHRKNVIILDPKNFADFIGYKEELYNEFMNTVGLTRLARYNENYRPILERRAVKSKKIINESFNNSQADYVKALRQSGKEDLLKHIGNGSEIIDFL